MEFHAVKKVLEKFFNDTFKNESVLYVTDVEKELVWETYLSSFPKGTNPVFRKRNEFDCGCCKQFVRAIGNVVRIRDNSLVSIWDVEIEDEAFTSVFKALSNLVKSAPIKDIFLSKENVAGTNVSHEKLENGEIRAWEHFYTPLPKQVVYTGSKSIESAQAEKRDVRNVFKRSLDEISPDSVKTVLELIAQKSLYKGEEWERVLNQFVLIQKEYSKLSAEKKEIYCWHKSIEVGPVIGKIRNHSIGTLLMDISEGLDLNEAVRKYEAIVAPTNYKRPKAIYTKRMIEDAQKEIAEMGYMDSLGRRHATLDDITVNNILFSNKDSAKRISGSVFDEMKEETTTDPKAFDKVEEISIEKFVEDVLPTVKDMEVLVENKHVSNLVSLIAPVNKEAPSMFKWANAFSWAYSGNITDSMKERVKAAGGKVDGVLRFSIQWNDENDNPDDLDAHCIEPGHNEIYFSNKGRMHPSSGMLDVDIVVPGDKIAVENIIYTNKAAMPSGAYQFNVHCYNSRGAKSGFSAEIEFDGQIHCFEYKKPLRHKETIRVATVNNSKKDGFTIKPNLDSTTSSRSAWGLSTNKFYPVSVMMFSPNYWDEQKGIGHKHFFFMMKECKNDTSPNGFFNEFLKEELLTHKRVFEALGNKLRVEDTQDQLSGLGFSSSQRNSIVCKVSGKFTRVLKINF